ncbi:MAG: ZIP family metal transporter, partial [Ignavibacteriae bacterium]|nr:ZIP family metal transporter [Ignavibacteriota bacterium]
FFAIILHKIPEGITVASITLASKQTVKTAMLALLTIGGATTLGIVAAFILAQVNQSLVGIAFAFTAGTVCYVGASDLIPEINRSENRIAPLIVLAGMLLFYFSQNLLEKIIH